jgi:hypothetical protein
MLPIYGHASAEQAMNPSYPAAEPRNARSVEPIPAGTIVPVSLNSTLRSDTSRSGSKIIATVLQDVPLGPGKTLRAGSKVTGHVVESTTPGRGSDESKITFQFDQVQFGNHSVPITADLRAVASVMEVDAAQIPQAGGDEVSRGSWNLVQIGGDQTSYGQDGPVILGSQVVGEYTGQGVLTDDTPPQALWLFAADASGTYGLGDIEIIHGGATEPIGEVTLASNRKMLKIVSGSAMLLRVESRGAEEAHSTASRVTAQ